MKKMDPRKQLVEQAAERAEATRRLQRMFRGDLNKVVRVPFTWEDPYSYSSFQKPRHLADAQGVPFYVGDRVVLTGTETGHNGAKGTVMHRDDMPEDKGGFDNGFNVAVRWDEPWARMTASDRHLAWVGQSFLLHDVTFGSISDVEDYLESS